MNSRVFFVPPAQQRFRVLRPIRAGQPVYLDLDISDRVFPDVEQMLDDIGPAQQEADLSIFFDRVRPAIERMVAAAFIDCRSGDY